MLTMFTLVFSLFCLIVSAQANNDTFQWWSGGVPKSYRQPVVAGTTTTMLCVAAFLEDDKGLKFRQGFKHLAWHLRSQNGSFTFLGGVNSTGSVSIHSDPQKYAIGSKTGFLTIYNVARADETEYKCTVKDQAKQYSEPHESFVKLDVIEIPVLATSPTTESRKTIKYLPVDGKWSAWGAWSPCTKTCGHGTKARQRVCNNPVPVHGGTACRGDTYEAQVCLVGHCSTPTTSITTKSPPVDGKWSAWGAWSPCTKTCGHGVNTRERVCNNPVPAHGGAACIGDTYEAQVCLVGHCSTPTTSITTKSPPVDGKWSAWGAWSPCTKTCGHGVNTRERVCNNPFPAHGGAACIGDTYEAQVCLVGHCSSKPSKSDESSAVHSWVLTGKILVALFIVSIAINLILARTYLKKCCLGLFENISGLFHSQNEIMSSSDVNHQNPTFEVPNCDGGEKSNIEENVPGTDAGGEIPLGIQENNTDNDVLRYNTLGL